MNFIKRNFYLLPVIIMTFSALAKIFLFKPGAVELPLPGMEERIFPVAMLELCCIVLFIIPRTMNIGFFLICSYLGGAIAISIFTNISPAPLPVIVLILCWIGMYFRNKALFFNIVHT